jgi:hypothetical protein
LSGLRMGAPCSMHNPHHDIDPPGCSGILHGSFGASKPENHPGLRCSDASPCTLKAMQSRHEA